MQVVCGEYTHAMPSLTPLSATHSLTSSVMSRISSPPLVLRLRSCWKTFTRAPTSRFEDDKDPLPVFLVTRGACVQKDRATLPLAGPVAQRSEQRTHNPWDPGSNPGGPTREPPGNGGFLFSDGPMRAARWQPRGQLGRGGLDATPVGFDCDCGQGRRDPLGHLRELWRVGLRTFAAHRSEAHRLRRN